MATKENVGDIEVGTVIEYEGEAATIIDSECEAVDTRMGGTYLYTVLLKFGDGTEETIRRWEGDELTVLN